MCLRFPVTRPFLLPTVCARKPIRLGALCRSPSTTFHTGFVSPVSFEQNAVACSALGAMCNSTGASHRACAGCRLAAREYTVLKDSPFLFRFQQREGARRVLSKLNFFERSVACKSALKTFPRGPAAAAGVVDGLISKKKRVHPNYAPQMLFRSAFASLLLFLRMQRP